MFCLFFVAFIFGMIAVFAFSFSLGEPRMIVRGWDSDGMGCGYNETTKDYPVLYWSELPTQSVIADV